MVSLMSQTEEVAEGAGCRQQCPGHPAQTTLDLIFENIRLRQRSRGLVARNRRIINEINDLLVFDVACAKQWRDARRGVSCS
jgi:hypothetical protein